MYTMGRFDKTRADFMAQDESTGKQAVAGAGYAVGYGKPPLHTRFRKGQSGNPRGRPRRKTDLASLLLEALNRRNASEERNARTRREAIVAALVEKSASGDLGATKLLFELMRQIGPAAEPPASPEDDPREILLRRLARLAGDRGKPGPE
jgi:hypothetical protein